MNLFDRALRGLFERRFRVSQEPADWFLKIVGAGTKAGVDVTIENSVECLAVFACVRILAETLGSLPLVTYRRLSRGKERATSHPLYSILHNLPNSEMSSIELRETLMGHLGLWGNAYAEIEWSNSGQVRGLWPLRPDKTSPKRVNGQIVYQVKMPGGLPDEFLPRERVMHLRGLGYDGNVGYSPISLARQAIGLAMATEEFGARFFSNDARPGAVLEHPSTLSKEAQDRLQKSWEKEHKGLSQKHRLGILEEGMKLHEVGIPPEDAQFLQTRRFQKEEIAMLYRISPHMLADLERATFSNIEHLSLEFVTYTMQPWLTRWEQAIYRSLLSERERQEYFVEHLVDALLRGDIASRYQAYNVGRNGGWLSANDIREKENMNPVDGGDVYLVPLNMIPADEVSGLPATNDEGRTTDAQGREARGLDVERRARIQNLTKARRRLARAYKPLIGDAVGRVVRREIADVRRAVEKYLSKRDAFQLATWLKTFYEEHREFWTRQILPVLLSYADQVGASVADELGGDARDSQDIRAFIDDYCAALAKREVGSSINQLQDLLDGALQDGQDPGEALNARLDEWEEKRVDKVTKRETTGMLGACTLAFYVLVGVTRKMWVNTGSQNCPYCQSLDGRVVEIEKFFLSKDTDFAPEGSERPLNVRYDVGHAPAHGGCDCIIVAA